MTSAWLTSTSHDQRIDQLWRTVVVCMVTAKVTLHDLINVLKDNEGYSKNVSCTLNKISTFLFIWKLFKTLWYSLTKHSGMCSSSAIEQTALIDGEQTWHHNHTVSNMLSCHVVLLSWFCQNNDKSMMTYVKLSTSLLNKW